jgi:splicing factor 3B subunit 3
MMKKGSELLCGHKLFFIFPIVPTEIKSLLPLSQPHHRFLTMPLTVIRIFSIDKLDNNILQESIPLAHTPRRFVKHPDQPLFYVIESDNNVLSSATQQSLIEDSKTRNGESQILPPEDFGYPRGTGHWASCIQIVDPISSKQVVFTLDLEDNEAAVSIAAVPFSSQDDETFLVVGTAKDLTTDSPSSAGGFIHIYRFQEDGRELEFIHKTKVDEPPLALLAFQGRVLAGIGSLLRLYDLGMKQLLRKCQAHVVPHTIVGLQTQGSRIVVSDTRDSVTYVVYKYQENILIPFVDDTIARWTTSTTMVDYETTAGGDKFGNIWLLRCPTKFSEEADEDGSGAHLVHERGYLHGTPNRLELMIHYYVQDIPTGIHKAQLVAGGRDILVWTGFQGTIGMFVPFVSREDVDFFQSLEMQLASQHPPLAGRDHLIYRGYYAPSKGVIDGDLCEMYFLLPNDTKMMIAAELDRSVREIERKISVS